MKLMDTLKSLVGAFLVATQLLPLEGTMANSEASHVVEYYQSFSGYSLPLHPVQKVSKEEAEAARTYCVAYFEGGRIVRLVKMLEGELFFEHIYAYHPNGKLMRAEVRNRDGAIQVHEFDASGTLQE